MGKGVSKDYKKKGISVRGAAGMQGARKQILHTR